MKLNHAKPASHLLRLLLASAAVAFAVPTIRAADHGDAPTLGPDQGADIADLYLFQDPGTAANVVLIGTMRGFIVPGEASNFAIFDPAIRFRFEIFNDHINVAPGDIPALPDDKKSDITKFQNRIKPARIIDVTFTPRVALAATTVGKEILQVPQPQTATVQFTGFKDIPGFTGKPTKDVFTGLDVLNPSLGDTSPDPTAVVETLGNTGIKFFAGEVDDPFFFDIPGFARFIGRVRNGDPLLTAAGELGRARDSFAGYNILAIALSVPKAALEGTNGVKIGADFLTQRHNVEMPSKTTKGVVTSEVKGVGAFKTVDRIGNPAVNVALIPFNRKNEHNAATAKDDAKGKFAGDIVATLLAINPALANVGSTSIATLANIAVSYGDLLVLDTAAPSGFPNGRRPQDDVVKTLLTVIADLGVPVDDGVAGNDVPYETVFPYLGKTQQPRTSLDPNNPDLTDDNTQN